VRRRLPGWMLAAVLAALAVGAAAPPAPAQTAARIARIGVLSPFIGPESLFFETLRRRLGELGYVEGRNIAFVVRAAEDFDHLQTHAREMVRLNVDVIVTAGPLGVRAARSATSTIPIVMGNVGDAVSQGFVASLAKPGGNVTGLSSLNTELSAKRLGLLKEALPSITRVAVLREAIGDAGPLRATEAAARAMGLTLAVFQVRSADELPSAFAAIAAERVGALEVLPGSMFVSQLGRIVELAATARVPAVYPDVRFVKAGGFMSYGPDIATQYERAAQYVDRLLRGAKPGDLPVEEPTALMLAVNVPAARALGVAVPQSLLLRADEVVR
jgi:putative tryptophan/tyrosine transport system substrate-binding protein